MTRPMNSHNFEPTYKSLGIDLDKLGCIMLDVEPHQSLDEVIPSDWLYTSPDPKKFWFNNVLDHLHVSLLYGLMENGNVWRQYVDEVLFGWSPDLIEVDYVDAFPSPLAEEKYSCIIAKLRITDNLLEAHQRLSFLPHIDTYSGYTPHITLAYVKEEFEAAAIEKLYLHGIPHFDPIGLNYGDPA